MSLANAGFLPEEIHKGVAWPDGRLGAHAEIQAETAVLLVSTGLRLDVYLEGSYVQRRGFSVLRREESFEVCAMPEFRALGRSRLHDTAVFSESRRTDGDGTYAGSIGVEYWKDGIVGLDAAGPSVSLSHREAVREHFGKAVCRIPLVPDTGSGLPVTVEVGESNAYEGRPALLIDTGVPDSCLTWSYVQSYWQKGRLRRAARWALRSGGKIDVEILLPGLDPIRTGFRIQPNPPHYLVDVGVREIHGVLGIDLLRRWIQVFDFPGRQLALFNYS